MRHVNWKIGCSGFYYKEWRELFYPKGLAQKNWFDFYAQYFNTVEINNTFYRFPEQSLFDNWYKKAPERFCFSVKVPRTITHEQKFTGTGKVLNEFYVIAKEGLKEKLGPILFQLPPQLAYSESVLEKMLAQFSLFHENVIEFRHISWWRKDVMDALQEKSVCFSGVSYPGLISDAVANLPLAYYRFHGVPKLYHSKYAEAFLETVARQLSSSPVKDAYVYFNNTASGAALENAQYLQYFVAT